MEVYSYVDMFATKGIEYVFVLGFLFLLIFFWKFLKRLESKAIKKE